jgi:hypothetical protein
LAKKKRKTADWLMVCGQAVTTIALLLFFPLVTAGHGGGGVVKGREWGWS